MDAPLPFELTDLDRFGKLPAPPVVAPTPPDTRAESAASMRPTWELICAHWRKAYHYA